MPMQSFLSGEVLHSVAVFVCFLCTSICGVFFFAYGCLVGDDPFIERIMMGTIGFFLMLCAVILLVQ